MTPSRRNSSHRPDLLYRPPAGHGDARTNPIEMLVDPVAQLSELADLYRRGLLGPQEFEMHKERLLNAYR
jgi:hypothetical protein